MIEQSAQPTVKRIAFQGEPGAYGEEAVLRHFGEQTEPVPCVSFARVFEAVISGETDGGFVPIENSQAGSINDVYDLLRSSKLFLTGELCLPVNHCLIALPGQRLSEIHRVESHPQALAQCDAYLRGLGVEIVAAYDTAGSAKAIREREVMGVAAVASARAADLYGLEILARGIQTVKDNFTRFVAINRNQGEVPSANAKTALLLATSHRPGALYSALGVFATRGINLLKLESRPSREKPWEYVFYLDVEGAADQPPLADALAALAESGAFIEVFGSFPRSPSC